MGKKSKKYSNLKISTSVSIVTPTTFSRKNALLLLAECIQKQTYISSIRQWVIVTAEWSSEDDFHYFANNSLRPLLPDNVKIDCFFSNEANTEKYNWKKTINYGAIGYLRNITNSMVTSDYIVCCDDDDYYVPTRVEHAVEKLMKSNKDVAGCSSHILYDFDFATTFQFKKIHENHSINSVLAYKKKYIDTGAKYDSTKTFAEEQTFLAGFSVPMIQLDPKHCVVQMVHCKNTFNKRKLILNSDLVKKEQKNIFKLSTGSKGYIPKETLEKYKYALTNNDDCSDSEFDIVYYLGNGYKPFTFNDTNLGGSEQAVKHITESWSNYGYKVCVYGDFENTVSQGGVQYKNYLEFKCSKKYNLLILWRQYGMLPILKYNLYATRLVVDLHDNLPLLPDLNFAIIDYFMVKSKFHGQCLNHLNIKNNLVQNIVKKIKIIPNGVRVDEFTPDINKKYYRNPLKFIYCSCYKRNLMNILKYLWPELKKLRPDAELSVMYGMDGVRDELFKKEMNTLLSQPGITDHGRQSSEFVRQQKFTSGFHLYYSRSQAETDCISIRESACAGCIPLLSKFGVFIDRNGVKLEGDPHDPNDLILAARKINELLKPEHEETINKMRSSLIGKERDWNKISAMWISSINILKS
jgi:hypothetical protein